MSGEVWKDVVGYEGYYQVSSDGRVKGVDRWYEQYNASAKRIVKVFYPEKLFNGEVDKDGYIKVQLTKDKVRKKFFVHRLVAIAFIANVEKKPEVNHKDGIKSNNSSENLEWMTSSENTRHALDTKLYTAARGEGSGMSKLTEVQVREIHRLYSLGNITHADLSKVYSVQGSAISRILTGVRWKHIYDELYGD